MDKKEELMKIFSKDIRYLLATIPIDYEQVQEVRLRINAPLLILYKNQEYYITKSGTLSKYISEAYMVSKNELRETMEYISNYSLYAFEEEIRQGFITVQGGHRVGIAGKAILDDENIKSIKYISFINVS